MNAKRDESGGPLRAVRNFLRLERFRPGPAAAVAACFAAAVAAAAAAAAADPSSKAGLREFEVGRIAERDVVAEKSVAYVDEEATRLRREAQERLVPAVFRLNEKPAREAIESFSRFRALAERLFEERASADTLHLAAQAEFPGAFTKDALDALYRHPSRARVIEAADSILRIVYDGGVFALAPGALDGFNPDSVELVRFAGGRSERERIATAKVVTLKNTPARIAEIVSGSSHPAALATAGPGLLKAFIVENAFYSPEDSARRLEEARSRVEPVMKRIERGDRVIRKGFIVSKEDLVRLNALGRESSAQGAGRIVGTALLVAVCFGIFLFLAGPRVIGRLLEPGECYLLAASAAAYFLGSAFAGRMAVPSDFFPSSIFLPTALFSMISAVLMGPRVAAAVAVGFPLVAFVSGSMDAPAFVFALASGVAGAYALQDAEKRMDLVRAGAVIAAAQVAAAAGLLFAERAEADAYLMVAFWSAFNGFACGMAVLGLLPIFEHALNAATPFRLIELSDLNTPALKRLLTVAPGTYSHSVMVANLAESAAREIGADALLARVGAYYHDIGKMDQPDYFVENQDAYNKHDELSPRLSATVIRSHVKIGIEKARKMGLPREIVDIIAEHHGNSVINWFYNEALKREDQVNADDFSYPGSPPRSRESAVVMLADTVEAAVRTLKRPTASRLDKFVQELIMSKFEQGQLSESELTFRDLEAIKNSFVRVMAGHYHSRIEYPKTREAAR